MAPTVKVILGSIAFAIFWAFQAVPFLPIGRTAGSLLGAMLMVIFQVITPDEAYKAIDLPILGLLFGTMLVTVYLEKADLFKHLTKLLSWRSMGAKDLLWRICLISAILSAFFTNDTACFVLTEFVLELARKQNLPPHPFLLALASSANIGSSATPIGNPQNLVIAVKSKITFWRFLFGILPATIVGVIINYLILLCMYWKSLSVQNDEQDATAEELLAIVNSQVLNTDFESMNIQSSPNFKGHMDHAEANLRNQGNGSETSSIHSSPIAHEFEFDNSGAFAEEGLGFSKKACVYLVTLGMLISMLVGLDMSWTAITAALTLVVLDFKDPGPCLEKVSYSLLILFCGMFITVDGFNKTGIPSTFWEFMKPYSKIDRVSGRVVLAVVVIVLSNLASNVPTVLLLGAQVAASAAALSPASDNKAWLILAWVSTVAGNLSLLGSAANLIVCEQAHRAQHNGKKLSFWTHLKFGVPSTLIITTIGLPLIRG